MQAKTVRKNKAYMKRAKLAEVNIGQVLADQISISMNQPSFMRLLFGLEKPRSFLPLHRKRIKGEKKRRGKKWNKINL
jgi:hypothetical protein